MNLSILKLNYTIIFFYFFVKILKFILDLYFLQTTEINRKETPKLYSKHQYDRRPQIETKLTKGASMH